MGKKKEPSVEDVLKSFKDVMKRSSLTSFISINNQLVSKNDKKKTILIDVDRTLLSAIIADEELKRQINELNMENGDSSSIIPLLRFVDNLDEGWFPLDADKLSSGKIISIKVHDKWEYEIPIGRSLLPLKLRKSENNNISYKIFKTSSGDAISLELGLKKKFESVVPDTNFTLIRMFKIY